MDKRKLLAKQCANIERKLKAGKTITAREQRQLEDFQNGIVSVTRKQAAEFFGVSEAAVGIWAKRGCSFASIEAISEWREEQKQGGDSDDLLRARLHKTLAETERLGIIIQRERGELVPVVEMRETATRVVSVWCSELDALVGDLPGQLAGLTEVEIQPKLRSRIELLKANAREGFAGL
jgi:hypothetical protein